MAVALVDLPVCQACGSPTQIPGPPGANGTNGTNGTNGYNAYSTLAASYTMPAELGSSNATFVAAGWLVLGQVVRINTLGSFEVTGISGTTVTLKNLKDTASSAYMDNAAPGTVATIGQRVVPAGLQGPAGALSGAAGGDLTGTYPNPTLVNTGPGVTSAGTTISVPQVSIDTKGRVTALTSAMIAFPTTLPPNGLAGGDLTGSYPDPTLNNTAVTAGIYGFGDTTPLINVDAKGRIISAADISVATYRKVLLLATKVSADFNTTADQSIPFIPSSKYRITEILITNASVNMTTAQGGFYNAISKPAGGILVASSQVYTALSTSTKFLVCTLDTLATTTIQTATTLYFSLSTPQGVAATADIYIFGQKLD